MISYEDLDLRLSADGKGFMVSACRGSQSAIEPFEPDLSLSWDLWQLETRGSGTVKEQGAALFDALIRGRVRDLYQQGRGGAGGDAAKGLRIRLLLDPRDERVRPLLQLPWEILFDRFADAGSLPALDPRRPIVRTIDSIEQTLSPTPGPLRRVLLALSSPPSLIGLDLASEYAGIAKALGRISVRPDVLKRVTRSRLLESICDGGHQIVHFMGHGTFDPALGEDVLVLENEDRGLEFLHASTFASFFIGKPMPRLVVLASCHSDELARGSAGGPFASVAAALVAAGLPAVVAMQTTVHDRSAIRFTERLYRRLVQGDPIEAAVSEARVALRAGQVETLDWAVPALFVRGQVEGPPIREASPTGLPSTEPRGHSINLVVNSRDVGIQHNIGYLHQGGEPGKK